MALRQVAEPGLWEALAEYVARREPTPVTAALDEVVEQLGDEQDQWLDEADRSALERSGW